MHPFHYRHYSRPKRKQKTTVRQHFGVNMVNYGLCEKGEYKVNLSAWHFAQLKANERAWLLCFIPLTVIFLSLILVKCHRGVEFQ